MKRYIEPAKGGHKCHSYLCETYLKKGDMRGVIEESGGTGYPSVSRICLPCFIKRMSSEIEECHELRKEAKKCLKKGDRYVVRKE